MRSINWFEHSSRSIASRYPRAAGCADFLTERLAALLLARLPRDIGKEIIELLPPTLGEHSWPLQKSIHSKAQAVTSHHEFIQRTRAALSCTELDMPESAMNEMAEAITGVFLWTMCQELPADLKSRLVEVLPGDLRSRMDLYCAVSDESRVA